jgi:XTP/dITP diphosphohydrolase
MEILVATGNAGKVREFRQMLGESTYTWKDLSQFSRGEEVEETGKTFRANACLKAREYAMRYKMWSLADDSGLEVEALDSAPAVHSARWAELHKSGKGDRANVALLLVQLKQIPTDNRRARFVCVLALADERGRILLTARDTVEGVIQDTPRGTGGFGYDPIFQVNGFTKTMAELTADEKHAVSHRGRALARLKLLMERTGIGA